MSSTKLSWIAVAAAPLLLWACAGELDTTLEEEISQFAALTATKPLQQACQELDKLCKSSGKGCKAHQLFCTGGGPGGLLSDGGPALPPKPDLKLPAPGGTPGGSFKQLICSNLKQACAKFPVACNIYNKHCTGAGAPQLDGGLSKPPLPDLKLPPLPDFKLPKLPDMGGKIPGFGFDKTKCCQTLDTCIKANDGACAAAKGVCGSVTIPSLPGGGAKMQLELLKMVYKAVCSI